MNPRREAESMLHAEFGKERPPLAKSLHIGSFGHEQDPVTGESGHGTDLIEQLLDFGKILDPGNDKLELAGPFFQPSPDDVWLQAGGFVALAPRSGLLHIGGRVLELGTEGGEITGDLTRRNRPRGLDGDVHPVRAEGSGQLRDPRGHHRFTTGQHDVRAVVGEDSPGDFRNAHFLTLWVPGGVGSVTPAAAKVASRGAHKDGRHP